MPPLGNRDLIREINRSNVLNAIKMEGPIARSEIARLTGLSPATITGISAELIAEDLVFEKAAGDSSGGRPPILLALNPAGRYAIGIKLAEESVTGVITDLEATILSRSIHTLRTHEIDPALQVVADTVEELILKSGIRRELILGAGVGAAGIMNKERGVLRYSPILGWRDVPIVDLLKGKLNIPVFIDNDVNTFTLTEKWFDVDKATKNFLTITVGRGVGLGIVVNDQIYRGSHGGGGEFGHTVLEPTGPICECGKRGCLEAYVSDPALLKAANALGLRTREEEPVQNITELLDMAGVGDEIALRVFAQAGEMLGRGVANLINIFSPDLIVISGEGVRSGDFLFDPMRTAIMKYVMPGLMQDTKIQIDQWADDAWARGAAGLVLQHLFAPPVQ
jgi:predicted NBD/HSP70 family sugar kinase